MKCYDCEHENASKLGTQGYELKATRFESFSEAHKHMMDNPDHYVDINVLINDNDDGE